MGDRLEQMGESAQSFVLRLWQEEPGSWRGRIRHVQSQAQQGFTSLSQVTAFVEQRLRSASAAAWATQGREGARPIPLLQWLPRGRAQTASIAAGLLALCLVALFVVDPSATTPLAGTASAAGITLDEPIIFLAGVAVGGLVVSFLNGSKQ